ncbi:MULTISPECIES: hypothetical protein [Mesorhizobium]|uniref:Uncharacterized protein n=1 Tax=Rhizobium loti TaxID=381 RepID=A0A8E2WAC4_RHILI|nr:MULTISPECIES: hypothetical protein [Mesorhizobium]PWJ88116.1 hypothetical protein C8D77_1129 [Mesorhizobium loti]QKC86743.1 hypothetical protein EB232_34355 [Mesorhizobium sp. NZP2077]QKD20441.1 hypothetical protein HGP13_36325 [Mesorhizobium sp. NZP2077]
MDEERPHRPVYRLQRIDGDQVMTVVTFYSAAEALTVLQNLPHGYRLTLDNRQVLPSSARHDDEAS